VTGFSRLLAALRAHPMVADALLAAALATAFAALLSVAPAATTANVGPVGPVPELLAWCTVGVLPVVVRRRWPAASIALCVVLALPPLFNEYALRTLGFSVLIVAYTAASTRPLPAAIAANLLVWLPSLAVGSVIQVRERRGSLVAALVIDGLLALIAFTVGRYIRTRRAYTAALEARAAEAEANQRALAHQAVGDERRRIARELHDVVAHHVSVMGVLATGARRALHRDPASADEALTAIEQTGRTTLRELRRLLDLLRADDEETGELVPQPGLAALRSLVDRIREAGLPVTTQIDGEPYPVDAGVALTVYRLVQEALTNVLKHAGPASAQLRVGFGPDELTVEVFDTGHGPRPAAEETAAAAGHGLVGMRERVALYGGELHTGPRPGGGFRVYARIPMDNLDGLSRLPTIA
jgi:signal transduction histidine kinase